VPCSQTRSARLDIFCRHPLVARVCLHGASTRALLEQVPPFALVGTVSWHSWNICFSAQPLLLSSCPGCQSTVGHYAFFEFHRLGRFQIITRDSRLHCWV
jgi:hypothetical protein